MRVWCKNRRWLVFALKERLFKYPIWKLWGEYFRCERLALSFDEVQSEVRTAQNSFCGYWKLVQPTKFLFVYLIIHTASYLTIYQWWQHPLKVTGNVMETFIKNSTNLKKRTHGYTPVNIYSTAQYMDVYPYMKTSLKQAELYVFIASWCSLHPQCLSRFGSSCKKFCFLWRGVQFSALEQYANSTRVKKHIGHGVHVWELHFIGHRSSVSGSPQTWEGDKDVMKVLSVFCYTQNTIFATIWSFFMRLSMHLWKGSSLSPFEWPWEPTSPNFWVLCVRTDWNVTRRYAATGLLLVESFLCFSSGKFRMVICSALNLREPADKDTYHFPQIFEEIQ